MRFDCRRLDCLPPLSWLARVAPHSPIVAVSHGAGVDAGPGGFFEGVWAGSFEEMRPDLADACMGSGGVVAGGAARFVAPSHNLERLFLLRGPGELLVSNSLAFVLETAGLDLDPGYPYYQTDLWSSMHGLDRAARTIPTGRGPHVHLLESCNLEVAADLSWRRAPKPPGPAWGTFTDYRDFLARRIAALVQNGRAPGRRLPLSPLATISSGYDSPAAAVLAAESGCSEAVTFRTGSEIETTGRVAPDSGIEIGHRLGMRVEEFDQDLPALPALVLAEFAACGDAFDLQFAALHRRLPGRLLFTGHPGAYWRRDLPLTTTLARTSPAGSGLTEFRVRVGFVHVPVPAIGADRHPQLHAISHAPEMQPWSVGGAYDRPIARRIVEEAGVPRDRFGTRKKGSFQCMRFNASRAACVPELWAFARSQAGRRPWSTEARLHLRFAAARGSWLLHRLGQAAGARLSKRTPLFDVPAPGPATFIVQWGNNVLRERYRLAGAVQRDCVTG